MAPRLTWSRLVPGIITIAVVIIATVGVLMYSSVGRVPGEKLRLYVVTNSAHGVMRGTEVWLAGQKVGVVEDVRFRPVTTDTQARVIMAIDVRARDAAQIRHDSDVRVRTGSNLVGPIVVYVSAGTPASPAARDGDTLVAPALGDVQDAVRRLGEATKNFGPLMNDARAVMSYTRNPHGTVGALRRSGLGGEMTELRSQVSALREAFGGSSPARARFMSSARVTLARVDSVRALLKSQENSIGRFRRDSTLGRTFASLRDEVAALRARMDEPTGTFQRFAADSAIQEALVTAQREMAILMEDFRKRPLRYIAF